MAIPISRNLLIAGVCSILTCFAQSGQVKSEGQPIPGATVRATQGDRILSTLTDQNGAFEFDGMTPGAWNVEVDMFGFDRARKEIQIPGKIDFTLQLRDRTRQANRGAPTEDSLEGLQVAAGVESGAVPQVAADASNESLLVNGSISQGLQTTQADMRQGLGGPGGPGGLGPGLNGLSGLNGLAGQGGQATAGDQATQGGQLAQAIPGGAAGPIPGAGPGGGGPGGGGFGGGGGRGGGGGFGGGGRGGGGRAGGRGPRDRNGNQAFIGNRRPNNNRITGSIYYQLGNSVLNARPFAVNGIPEPKAAYAQNRFGFSAGGPLFVPKLFDASKVFWFVNYQGNLSKNGVDQAFNEPTALQRMGDFSQTNSIIYDPTTNAPFPNNKIPLARISPIAQGLLSYLPLPNENVSGINQNYRLIVANPNNTQSLNTRVNTTLTPKDTLAVTFNLQKRNSTTDEYFGCCDTVDGQGLNTNINWRRRLSTRNFNNVTLSFNRNTNTAIPFFANGPNVGAELGILGTSPNPANFGPPSLIFTNYSSLSDTNESRSAIWNYGLADNLQIHRGKHNWNFGGGFTHYLSNTITDQNGRGSFNFSGLSTSGYTSAGLPISGTGYDFADFLLGLPESSAVRYNDSSVYYRSNGYNAFVVDDYRVATNLSLNLGLRYEYFSPWHEEYGHAANLDIAPGFSNVAPVLPGQAGPLTGAAYPNSLVRPDRNNFGPRAALAWKPWARGKTLVRAGFGWYYVPNQYNVLMNQLAAEPPFAVTNSVTTSSADVLTLGTGLLALPAGKTVTNSYAAALNYLDSYIQTWNFSIQQDLPKRLVGEITYTGTKGTRLNIQEAPNQAPLGSALTGYQRLPIADAGNFIFDDPVGNLEMNAMQVRLTRRFQRGLSWNLFYTLSKSIDDVALAQNFYDQAAERALSPNNHENVVTANWVWASPVDATRGFLSHPAFVAKALKDWTVSGSLTAQSGAPLTATIAGNRDGTSSLAPLRANATGLPVDSGSGYFNLAAFSVPAAGTYGDAGRDTITGPGMIVWNFSLARSINLNSERRRLEIRFDSTNTFNHVNPTGLITIVNSSQYGLITNAGQMRQMTATIRLRF